MEKSWLSSAHSIAPTASSAAARTTKTQRRPARICPGLWRTMPAASRKTPIAEAPTPSAIPRIPRVALTLTSRSCGRALGRRGVLGVDLGRRVLAAVLDHDAVAVERRADGDRGPAALA